jgi:lysophospholipase L1-like esterase
MALTAALPFGLVLSAPLAPDGPRGPHPKSLVAQAFKDSLERAAKLPGLTTPLLAPPKRRPCTGSSWVGAWGTAPAYAERRVFEDQTLRLIAHPNLGGRRVRVRLSNRFGGEPLILGSVTIARRGFGAALADGSHRRLTFMGRRTVTIPAGAELVSDPVALSFAAFQDLAVSLHVHRARGGVTTHPRAFQTSYLAAGDHASDRRGGAFASRVGSWYFLAGIDVGAPERSGAVVGFGDASVDGTGSPDEANHRFTDFLAERLESRSRPPRLSVLNAGVAGNRLLVDTDTVSGLSLLSRVGRDVIRQPGASDVIVWLGSGDDFRRSPPATAAAVIAGLSELTGRLHRRGLNVMLATISPSAGSPSSAGGIRTLNAKRRAVNRWIRTGGAADSVADLDAVLRDPARPDFLNPRYDSGDGQHPNSTGYHAAAQAIRLSRLRGTVCP